MRTSRLSLIALGIAVVIAGVVVLLLRTERQRVPIESAAPGGTEAASPSGATATPPVPAVAQVNPGPEAARTTITDGVLDAVVARDLEVLVADARGDPIAAARVGVFTQRELLGDETTDEHGLARFASRAGRGEAVVRAPGCVPWFASLPLDPGRAELTAPAADALSGALRIDRAVPREPVELVLRSDRPLFDTQGIPLALLEALALEPHDRLVVRARTGAGGTFRFDGLAEPFSGSFELPEELFAVAVSSPTVRFDRSEIDLARLEHDLIIDAIELPLLSGRIVETAGGRPVAGAEVSAWAAFVSNDVKRERPFHTSSVGDVRSDPDGRFQLRVRVPRNFDLSTLASAASLPPLDKVGLDVARDPGGNSSEFEVPAARMAGPWDVGEVVLGPSRRIEFVAKDGAGAPIAGVVAMVESPSAPTDAEGRGVLENVASDAESVRIGAVGWREVELPIPVVVDEPLQVTLQRTNRLELVFVDAAGAPQERQRVILAASGAIFAGGDPLRESDTHVATGSGRVTRSSRRGPESTCELRADEHGVLVLTDLVPGVAIAVRIADAVGSALEERRFTLAAEEVRRETIVVESGTPFFGRVLDDQGLPLADASVQLSTGRRGGQERRRTDPSGEFRFERLQPGTYSLEVSREGFSPLANPKYELPLDDRPAEFRLFRSIQIGVSVVDTAGRAVPTESMRARSASHPNLSVRRKGPSAFELRNLPEDSVLLIAWIGGRDYQREIDPRLGDAQLVVPEHGMAYVRLSLESSRPAQNAEYHAQLFAGEAPNEELHSEPFLDENGSPGALFEALLPGSYLVYLETWTTGANHQIERKRLGGAVEFQVRASETSKVQLAP